MLIVYDNTIDNLRFAHHKFLPLPLPLIPEHMIHLSYDSKSFECLFNWNVSVTSDDPQTTLSSSVGNSKNSVRPVIDLTVEAVRRLTELTVEEAKAL